MNNLYPSFYGNVGYNSTGGLNEGSSPFFYARVKDIVLSTKTKTDNFFTSAGGWAGLGSIKFIPIGSKPDNDRPSILIAKPLFTNLIQYPILEEVVLILTAPSIGLNDDPQAQTFYYLSTIGLWNSVHHNAFPDISNFVGEDLNFGNTFLEKSNIRNLLPEEGDILVEGRFGNSIRFSSTTPQKIQNNSWSSQGELGSPITIIRNKQSEVDINPSPWVPVYEDINFDGSSIYLCSGQDIPLEYSSKNLKSFGVTLGASFNSALQIADPILTTEDQSPISADKLK